MGQLAGLDYLDARRDARGQGKVVTDDLIAAGAQSWAEPLKQRIACKETDHVFGPTPVKSEFPSGENLCEDLRRKRVYRVTNTSPRVLTFVLTLMVIPRAVVLSGDRFSGIQKFQLNTPGHAFPITRD